MLDGLILLVPEYFHKLNKNTLERRYGGDTKDNKQQQL